MDRDLIELVTQLGGFSLVALTVVWFILKGIPMLIEAFERLQAQHRSERDSDRAAFLSALKENTASVNGVGAKVDDLHEKFEQFTQKTLRS
jgi:hypothetical protein